MAESQYLVTWVQGPNQKNYKIKYHDPLQYNLMTIGGNNESI